MRECPGKLESAQARCNRNTRAVKHAVRTMAVRNTDAHDRVIPHQREKVRHSGFLWKFGKVLHICCRNDLRFRVGWFGRKHPARGHNSNKSKRERNRAGR